VGLTIDVWEEDGLGTARGFFVTLENDCIVLVRELDHQRNNFDYPGPTIFADGWDAVGHGHTLLLDQTLKALSLSKSDVYLEPENRADWLMEIEAELSLYGKNRPID
jgi:hypothetical protein